MTVALIILLLGTGSLYVAAESGEAAAKLADRTEVSDAVLIAHRALATKTEVVFSVLTSVFLAWFLWVRLRRQPETRVTSTLFPIAFLAFYAIGIAYLVNTAHAGGRLVHEFGVHTTLDSQLPHSTAAACIAGVQSSVRTVVPKVCLSSRESKYPSP
jgi:uncharacterized membrane protein